MQASTGIAPQTADVASNGTLYKLHSGPTRDLLIKSAPLMAKWAQAECRSKPIGGMEEWAKGRSPDANLGVDSCAWYHGTWQYMRLLNMVAVPPWYGFYRRALSSFLRRKPHANVLISACADWGMLAELHEAVKAANATIKITICDICNTPLLACQWYADLHGLKIECVCDNIISTPKLPSSSFDLIVTDEFLTVLKAEYKHSIVTRWKELLKPGGALVTTAMIGGDTTTELRKRYAAKARSLLTAEAETFRKMKIDTGELIDRVEAFATYHTRHMIKDEDEIRNLLSDQFYINFLVPTATPGECVNPTYSFQILASLPNLRSA